MEKYGFSVILVFIGISLFLILPGAPFSFWTHDRVICEIEGPFENFKATKNFLKSWPATDGLNYDSIHAIDFKCKQTKETVSLLGRVLKRTVTGFFGKMEQLYLGKKIVGLRYTLEEINTVEEFP